MKETYTLHEIAEKFGVHPLTIHRWIKEEQNIIPKPLPRSGKGSHYRWSKNLIDGWMQGERQ